MRKLLVILAIVVSAVVGSVIVKPGLRTEWYFAADRAWTTHWPLAYGKYVVRNLRPLIRPTAPAWITIEPSITMWLDPADDMSAEILRQGSLRPEGWDAIRPYLTGDAVFVDVGARIGYYSLKAAAALGPHGRVIAVEPNQPALKKLQSNISASNASRVHVYPVVCADRDSALTPQKAPNTNRVRARRLDSIVLGEGVQRVDVLKIGVDSEETLVLRGAQWTLDRFHPVVIVELIEQQLQAMGTSSAELRRLMTSHGYVERADPHGFNFVFKWDGGAVDTRAPVDD